MVGLLFMLVYLAVIVGIVAGVWKAFEKAGKPGWAAIVPIYNLIVLAEIAGRPQYYGLLCLIPFAGIVFAIILMLDVAKSFGQSTGFGIGLALLGFVFWPMLGFGDAKYLGPTAPQAGFAPVMAGATVAR